MTFGLKHFDLLNGRTLMLLFLILFVLAACDLRKNPIFEAAGEAKSKMVTEATQKAIKESADLTDLDNFCTGLPGVGSDTLIRLGQSRNSPTTLFYYFETSRTDEVVEQQMKDRLSDGDWDFSIDSYQARVFVNKNKNLQIEFTFTGLGDKTDYAISCGRIH